MRRTTALVLAAGFLAGCSAADYRADADEQVYGILGKVAEAVTGDSKTYVIGRPEETLRDRLVANPDRLVLDLETALDVAAEASRDFESRKESLYLAALDLTREQHDFAVRFGGGAAAEVNGVGDDSADLRIVPDLSSSVNTLAGTRIVGSFFSTFMRSILSGGNFDGSSILSLSITQPLLRGFGQRIVREPLTQAERNVVYEIRSFERYRKILAVQITSQYFQLARQIRDFRSEQANYRSRKTAREQIEALFDAGRRDINQLDQASQTELTAENRVILALIRIQTSLDDFKLQLGLPITTELTIDIDDLTQLAELGVDPVDLEEETAIELALERRYDYATALDRVVDASRKIVVAEDALRSMLDFSAAFAVPSKPGEPFELDWSQVDWAAGFSLDLALDRLPERNVYRSSLISLDVAIRAREQLEDTIRADVRASLRDIRSRIETYRIQTKAVELAERRVDSTAELYDAGRSQARDVLEAQDALLDARLALSAALVDYQISRLELMRDLEALAIEPKGLRYDRSLPIPAAGLSFAAGREENTGG